MPHPVMQWFYRLASPVWFYRLTAGWSLPLAVSSALLLLAGLVWGLGAAPADFRQGEVYRIIYLHVPAAALAQSVYAVIGLAGAVFWIWRIKLAAMLIEAAAPVGLALTGLALATGAVWGRETWGAWWLWRDPRLMSTLVLLFLYLGLVALRRSFDDAGKADRALSVLAVVGLANLPVIRYSVEWWNSIHQPASLSVTGSSSLHPSILWPLLWCMLAFALAMSAAVLMRLQLVVLRNEAGGGRA